jgi:NADPH:quinone reductase
MSRLIRAARLIDHAATLRLEEVELRDPGPGEVVVELAAAGVNPVDGYRSKGLVAPDAPLPRTLGSEASGWLDGEPVVVFGGGLGDQLDGVWAEAVTVDRAHVIPLDPRVDLFAAAGLPVVGATAYNTTVALGRVGPEDRVLVLAAGGGTGLSIVSLALSAGAAVMGQVGSEDKAAVVRQYGATAVIADAASLAEAVGNFGPTITFDSLGGAFTPAALALLPQHGRHVIFGTSAGPQSEIALLPLYRASQQILGYGGLGLSPEQRVAAVSAAGAALADGSLRVHVGQVLPLSQAADVFDVLADRSRPGKLVIDCRR